MKFFLISDNIDTSYGMRLSGIEGVVLHEKDETERAIEKACADDEIGIILITAKLAGVCSKLVDDIKLNRRKPLIVTIPDRHGNGSVSGSISKYIEQAIGIKL